MEITCLITATSSEIIAFRDQIASLSSVHPTVVCCIDQRRGIVESNPSIQNCTSFDIGAILGNIVSDFSFMLSRSEFSLLCSLCALENLLEHYPVFLLSPYRISDFLSTHYLPPHIEENSILLPGGITTSTDFSLMDDVQSTREHVLFDNGELVRNYVAWGRKKIEYCCRIISGSATPLRKNAFVQKHWHFFNNWIEYAWAFGCKREVFPFAAKSPFDMNPLGEEKDRFDNGTEILEFVKTYYLRDYRLREKCENNPFAHPDLFLEKNCRCGDDHPVPITAPMMEIYSLRNDLRTSFPSLEGDNRLSFVQWFLSHGKQEHLLPDQYTRPIEKALAEYECQRKNDIGGDGLMKALRRGSIRSMLHSREICEPKEEKPSHRPNGVNLCGFIRGDFGLGEAARIVATALSAACIPFTIVNCESIPSHTYSNKDWNDKITNTFPYNTNIMLTNINGIDSLRSEIAPEAFSNRYNIAFWYWELPEFPEEWASAFDGVDEVWTSSDFTKQSFENVTEKPVYVIPCCLEEQREECLTRKDFNLPSDAFLFLMMYDIRSTQARKNPEGVIQAFDRAFGNREDVGLVIKINAPEDWVDETGLVDELRKRANAHVIIGTLSKPHLNSLISLCDVFVSLHRSEGFGLGPAEAMYWGVPAILTDWSGNQVYMTDDNCCPVQCKIVEIAESSDFYRKGWHWADPDLDQASDFMKRLVEDPEFYKKTAERGQKTIREDFSPRSVGKTISKRLHVIWKRLNS
ncbi:hypothetical protein C1878_15910 [Gordonibacter sp. 28C]|uniref:glycosyltransferase family 4 protein n=1 Tax=Gordonibacter sp. 28C TaxID=2078569 RepID=UPI000DF7B9D4|nr:glycosyltransferase [Gordonibacter sp. 28C]RDB58978.1 hypothetical protein C1878_15910 [Gordonibacter sp. 28C]